MNDVAPPDSLRTVRDAVERKATRNGDDTFLVYRNREVSYRDLDRQSNAIANEFRAQGIQPGDHVCLFMYNSPEYVFSVFALAKIGAVSSLLTRALLARRLNTSWALGCRYHLYRREYATGVRARSFVPRRRLDGVSPRRTLERALLSGFRTTPRGEPYHHTERVRGAGGPAYRDLRPAKRCRTAQRGRVTQLCVHQHRMGGVEEPLRVLGGRSDIHDSPAVQQFHVPDRCDGLAAR